jgi:hypothetical protein
VSGERLRYRDDAIEPTVRQDLQRFIQAASPSRAREAMRGADQWQSQRARHPGHDDIGSVSVCVDQVRSHPAAEIVDFVPLAAIRSRGKHDRMNVHTTTCQRRQKRFRGTIRFRYRGYMDFMPGFGMPN